MRPLERLRRFRTDESGTVTMEFLLVFPFLAWMLLISVVFFQGFQSRANNVKATYTVADILSREVNAPVTPEHMDSLFSLFQRMVPNDNPEMLRVTVFRYRETGDVYRLVWSQVRGAGTARTEAELAMIRDDRLPVMFDGEVGILVESVSGYDPAFTVGVDPFDIENQMVIRPRFAPTLCWSASNAGPWTTTNQVC